MLSFDEALKNQKEDLFGLHLKLVNYLAVNTYPNFSDFIFQYDYDKDFVVNCIIHSDYILALFYSYPSSKFSSFQEDSI